MVQEHNRRNAPDDGYSDVSRSGVAASADPFSLDGLPVGNAADLFDVGKHVNAIRNPDGSVHRVR